MTSRCVSRAPQTPSRANQLGPEEQASQSVLSGGLPLGGQLSWGPCPTCVTHQETGLFLKKKKKVKLMALRPCIIWLLPTSWSFLWLFQPQWPSFLNTARVFLHHDFCIFCSQCFSFKWLALCISSDFRWKSSHLKALQTSVTLPFHPE